jgi:carbamoyltransferase
MSAGPLVLGINRTQDASACLMQGSRLLWPERPVDVVVECFSSDEELAATLRLASGCRRARNSHLLAHFYSV